MSATALDIEKENLCFARRRDYTAWTMSIASVLLLCHPSTRRYACVVAQFPLSGSLGCFLPMHYHTFSSSCSWTFWRISTLSRALSGMFDLKEPVGRKILAITRNSHLHLCHILKYDGLLLKPWAAVIFSSYCQPLYKKPRHLSTGYR